MHTEHKYNLERYDDDDGNSNYNNDNNNNNNNNPIYDLTRPRPENKKGQQNSKWS